MKKKRIILVMVIALLYSMSFYAHAGQLNLEPAKIVTIASPENSRDTRVLLFFDLPDEFEEKRVEVEQAILIFNGRIADADFVQIDVFPVTTEWAQSEAVSWTMPWNKAGADYTDSFMGRSTILKRDEGEKPVRANVTFMVKAWLDNLLENNGMVIVPALDELHRTRVKYHFGEDGITLKITYYYDDENE